MRKFYPDHLLLLLAIILGFSSCEVINPSEDIPAYIRIDSISFMDTVNNQPVLAKKGKHRIVDAWVFIDNELQGVYELPVTFPVLKSGNHTVKVYGGILRNSISSQRTLYAFYTPYIQTVNLQPEKTDTLRPLIGDDKKVIKLPSEAIGQFEPYEGFEGAGSIFKITANSKVLEYTKTDVDSLVFEGNFSALFEMDANANYLEFETNKSYTIPQTSPSVYMELNYKIDVPLLIGIYVEKAGGGVLNIPYLNLVATNGQWKKAYVSLTSETSLQSNAKYKIYYKAYHDQNMLKSRVLIDNVRLIYQ